MSQYDQTFDLIINVSHYILYFIVQWFCVISWRMFDVWTSYFGIMGQRHLTWDYESVWPDVWPPNKCRLLLPIFHGPVILCYFLKTIWYVNIILWDYGSVWPDVWPKNKCRSLWHIFHGQVILPYIYVYLEDYLIYEHYYWKNASVWHKELPHQIYVGQWLVHVFRSQVIFAWYVKDYLKGVWCMNIILWDYGSETFDLKINVGHCDLYFMVQWFCHISWRLFDVWTFW